MIAYQSWQWEEDRLLLLWVFKEPLEERIMRLSGVGFVLVAGLALSAARAEDAIKSGPDTGKRIGGAFDVKAFSGDNKGKKLCYV